MSATDPHLDAGKPTPESSDDKHERFLRLYAAHQRQLHGYIGTFIYTPADVSEVAQETSIVLWRKFEAFDPTAASLRGPVAWPGSLTPSSFNFPTMADRTLLATWAAQQETMICPSIDTPRSSTYAVNNFRFIRSRVGLPTSRSSATPTCPHH